MAHAAHTPLPPLRIAVLAGGDSAEREISLMSGRAVAEALSSRSHNVALVDPRETPLVAEASSLRACRTPINWSRYDAAFIALHGRFGEDGQVQRLLDEMGVPYTGSRPDASRLAFSKSAAKERFAQRGVPTLPSVLIHETDQAARIAQQAELLGYPLVVKPDTQGSSLGVSIVRAPAELPRALGRCFHYDAFGLLERAVLGRSHALHGTLAEWDTDHSGLSSQPAVGTCLASEWTLGLIDDEPLPLLQIEHRREFFNFAAKYEDGATDYRFESPVPDETARQIVESGRLAAAAVGTRGIARVDLLLDAHAQPWVLEVNTIPGLTDHSLVPKAAARAGIGFPELCERALASCLKAREREVE